MKLYRVITENIHFQAVVDYLKEHKLDATIISGCYGLWQGQLEKSIVIEIASEYLSYNDQPIRAFVYWLKKYNGQEAVMLQIIDAEVKLM